MNYLEKMTKSELKKAEQEALIMCNAHSDLYRREKVGGDQKKISWASSALDVADAKFRAIRAELATRP